jgi:hypothetical protein
MALDINNLSDVIETPVNANGERKRTRHDPRKVKPNPRGLGERQHKLDPVMHPYGHTPEQIAANRKAEADRLAKVKKSTGRGDVAALLAMGLAVGGAWGGAQLADSQGEKSESGSFTVEDGSENKDQPVFGDIAREGDNATSIAQRVIQRHFDISPEELEELSPEQAQHFRDVQVHLTEKFNEQAGGVVTVGEEVHYTMDDLNTRAETRPASDQE